MGFKQGAYCTVWETKPVSDAITQARISISKKNKQTDEYETDFSGYVSFIGTASAKKASLLKEKDRIRLGEVDVSNTYNKEKKVTYTNFKVFSFQSPDELQSGSSSSDEPAPSKAVDDGEPDGSRLPF